ncbi:hypothetical protein PWT90_07224 [Aphanocladium album]|nr:hypothetical protein PWT90_07224 [Aphanocladium album]
MKDRFTTIADSLQSNITAAVNSYLAAVRSTLDLVGDDNIALENQRDVALHNRVNRADKESKRVLLIIHEQIRD